MPPLSPAEKIRAAFDKRKIDRVPVFHAGFSSAAASVLLGREAFVGGGINQWREAVARWNGPDAHAEYLARCKQDAWDLSKAARCDVVRAAYWRMNQRPAQRLDERTFLYGDPDGDFAIYQVDFETEMYQVVKSRSASAPETVDGLEREVAAMEEGLENYGPGQDDFALQMETLEHFGGQCAVFAGGYGLSVPNRDALWLEAVALRPDLVERYLEVQCVKALRTIEAAKDLPLPYHSGGGDFCGMHGPNYSPRVFHEMLLPRLQRMSGLAHEHGKFTIFATDGNVWPVADDLFGASGTDAFHEMDRRAGMDHWRLRRAYPRLTCFGNISSYTLHRGAKDEVVAECRDNAEAALELGGVVAGLSNYALPGTPPENLFAMIEALAEYQ